MEQEKVNMSVEVGKDLAETFKETVTQQGVHIDNAIEEMIRNYIGRAKYTSNLSKEEIEKFDTINMMANDDCDCCQ